MEVSINIRGRLLDFGSPCVMGILNVTPDSFYSGSRAETAEAVVQRARRLLAEGANMLDLGACSTRPNSSPVSEEEEWQRLAPALEALRRALPDAALSVDTFRASIARRSVQDFGVEIINDISGGELDSSMFETVAELGVPYILMHGGSPASVLPDERAMAATIGEGSGRWEDLMIGEVARYLSARAQLLHSLGVADVILDPGFGFGKTMAQNYALLRRLPDLMTAFPGYALLVGLSRKRMVHSLLNITPEEALNGTTVLNTLALQGGAQLLRVHDVREAVEAVRIYMAYKS